MIAHIVRKDWRLVWPLALIVAGLQAVLGVMDYRALPFGENHGSQAVSALVTIGLVIAMSLLIIQLIHQDAIPGENQDWLVRPIRRGDLLLAKLLGIALYIHGPIIIVSLLQCLAHGFPLAQSLHGIFISNVAIVLVCSLPLAAAASLTKTVTETLVTLLVVALGLLLLHFLLPVISYPVTRHFKFEYPTVESGVAWVWRFPAQVCLLASLLGVLCLQYFRRDTRRSRWLFIAGFLLLIFLPALPWSPAFRLQQLLSPGSLAANRVILEQADQVDAKILPPAVVFLTKEDKEKEPTNTALISIALSLASLPTNAIAHTDRVTVRMLDGQTVIYRGRGEAFDLRTGDGKVITRQDFRVPDAIYARYQNRPLTLQLRYSLTFLGSRDVDRSLALGEAGLVQPLGQCVTRLDSSSGADVGCRRAGELPDCLSARLTYPLDGTSAPEQFECSFNYAPALLRFPISPSNHFEMKFSLADAVAGTPRVTFALHPVLTHVTRTLMVPQFFLRNVHHP
jgi:hypothetical protein